jgi:hypothetical protein
VLTLAVIGSILVAGTAWGAQSSSAKVILFTAKYAGTATTKVTDTVATIAAKGVGTGTLIKRSKITGNGVADTSQQPCVPFTGPGSMTNATGTKILFKVLPGSTGCGDEDGNVFSISGRAQVTGGTKAFRKAKGSLKFTGVYDKGQGTFTVKFTGKVTVP